MVSCRRSRGGAPGRRASDQRWQRTSRWVCRPSGRGLGEAGEEFADVGFAIGDDGSHRGLGQGGAGGLGGRDPAVAFLGFDGLRLIVLGLGLVAPLEGRPGQPQEGAVGGIDGDRPDGRTGRRHCRCRPRSRPRLRPALPSKLISDVSSISRACQPAAATAVCAVAEQLLAASSRSPAADRSRRDRGTARCRPAGRGARDRRPAESTVAAAPDAPRPARCSGSSSLSSKRLPNPTRSSPSSNVRISCRICVTALASTLLLMGEIAHGRAAGPCGASARPRTQAAPRAAGLLSWTAPALLFACAIARHAVVARPTRDPSRRRSFECTAAHAPESCRAPRRPPGAVRAPGKRDLHANYASFTRLLRVFTPLYASFTRHSRNVTSVGFRAPRHGGGARRRSTVREGAWGTRVPERCSRRRARDRLAPLPPRQAR